MAASHSICSKPEQEALRQAVEFFDAYASNLRDTHTVNGRWGRTSIDREGKAEHARVTVLARRLSQVGCPELIPVRVMRPETGEKRVRRVWVAHGA